MSVAAVFRSSAAAASGFMTLPAAKQEENFSDQNKHNQEAEKPPGKYLDVWSSIQTKKVAEEKEVYVHPLMRRSSSLLSQKSLELCTENLGSETGSDFFVSDDDEEKDFFSFHSKEQEVEFTVTSEGEAIDDEEETVDVDDDENESKQKLTFNYHCSGSSSRRSFPPPLPSISRRDGPCLQMRPHRRHGRLVVEAVTVPSQNYLHAERQGGRLLLSFINTTTSNYNVAVDGDSVPAANPQEQEQCIDEEKQEESIIEDEEEEEEEEAEEEEEVEVVDRGTVIEVKVSTQPQQSIGGPAAVKVHRSSIVINKFVSCLPTTDNAVTIPDEANEKVTAASSSAVRRVSASTTTTAAAAAVAASSVSALSAMDGSHSSTNENRLLFASKRRNREELLHDMRRCSQLREPLFIWEPCCIATSS